MSSKIEKCPLCDEPANFRTGYAMDRDTNIHSGYCDRCGSVHVTGAAVRSLGETKRRYLLSAFFRRYEGQPPLVESKNVDSLIDAMPVLRTVREKLNGLLKLLADTDLPPGEPAPFEAGKDYPLVFAAGKEEANYLLGQL